MVTARAEQRSRAGDVIGARLRSRYLTEAADRGVPLQDAMQQLLHKSMAQAATYYTERDRRRGKAVRLIA